MKNIQQEYWDYLYNGCVDKDEDFDSLIYCESNVDNEIDGYNKRQIKYSYNTYKEDWKCSLEERKLAEQ